MNLGKGVAILTALLVLPLATQCTGGSESTAAEERAPRKNGIAPAETSQVDQVDTRKTLDGINKAIPLYAGSRYRDDLTRRDAVMIRNQYGPNAKVFTLASDDSFPQVYHYYTTYLAQFRAFPSQDPYPPEQQNWRTLEVQLNQAMQDPFIPGEALRNDGQQVMLQVAETEAEPKTVIRYIITPANSQVAATTASGQTAEAAAR